MRPLAGNEARHRQADEHAELLLRTGCVRDYRALGEHHYRAARPATITRVLVLEHPRRSAAARFTGRDDRAQVVGVLVESLPALHCRLRDHALGDRYGGLIAPGSRAAALNREIRCISRVVVHPQYRGLGLAVRLVRAALADPRTPITEAIAAMGKVHPFFERAGMTAYHRPPHPFDARLADALHSAGFEPVDLARLDHLLGAIDALPIARRRWLQREITRWHQHTRRTSRVGHIDTRDMLLAARTRLLCEPVYFVKAHRTANP